jgi:hypothetical protein
MDDITNKYEFQLILQEAAQYRLLRRVIDSFPVDERDSGSGSIRSRECLASPGRADDK